MLLKSNPYTPARRQKLSVSRKALGIYNGSPKKDLTVGVKRSCGINNQGRKTVQGRGGSKQRRVLRVVDFSRRSKAEMNAIVERIEIDPHRTSHIALVKYEDNSYTYITACEGMKQGDFISCSLKGRIGIEPGNRMLLKHIPHGTFVNNVEFHPNKRARIATSAGAFVKIVGSEEGKIIIKFPSGEQRALPEDSLATVGIISNSQHKNISYGGAGMRRRMGWRPKVRGNAKNSNDHALGGGKFIGRVKCNAKGVPIGKKTSRSRTKSTAHVQPKKSRRG